VSPRFETDIRYVFCKASTVEGRRWSRTSLISGSSFFPHILESAELVGEKMFRGGSFRRPLAFTRRQSSEESLLVASS
jgi:hypothetical protein